MSTKQTILVVEDDLDDAFFFEWVIHETVPNKKVQLVQSGEEAFKYLEGDGLFSNRELYPLPSLVFLDLKLPRINGFDILRWKNQRPHLKMPFIVLSASLDERDLFRSNELGAGMFLSKPLSKEVLLSCFKQFGLD